MIQLCFIRYNIISFTFLNCQMVTVGIPMVLMFTNCSYHWQVCFAGPPHLQQYWQRGIFDYQCNFKDGGKFSTLQKEKNFIFLVRGKDVKYVSDRKYQIKLKSRDVLSHLTPPIHCYFGCSMSHILIHQFFISFLIHRQYICLVIQLYLTHFKTKTVRV